MGDGCAGCSCSFGALTIWCHLQLKLQVQQLAAEQASWELVLQSDCTCRATMPCRPQLHQGRGAHRARSCLCLPEKGSTSKDVPKGGLVLADKQIWQCVCYAAATGLTLGPPREAPLP